MDAVHMHKYLFERDVQTECEKKHKHKLQQQ